MHLILNVIDWCFFPVDDDGARSENRYSSPRVATLAGKVASCSCISRKA